jgi:hypothetical protein
MVLQVTAATRTPAFSSSVYEGWYQHFREKRDVSFALPFLAYSCGFGATP